MPGTEQGRAQPLSAVSLGHRTSESGQCTRRKDPPQPSLLNYLLFFYKGNGLGENRELIFKASQSNNHFPFFFIAGSSHLRLPGVPDAGSAQTPDSVGLGKAGHASLTSSGAGNAGDLKPRVVGP